MMKGMSVGSVAESSCRISDNSPNGHVLSVGITGSGKSVRNEEMELDAAKNRHTVIVIDTNLSRKQDGIFEPIRDEYSVWTNRIDAREDGLSVSFLQPMAGNDGRREDYVKVVNSAVLSLSAGYKMGIRQMTTLRKAVIFAMENYNNYTDEMTAVGVGLLQQEDTTAEGVYQRLWTVFNSQVFFRSVKYLRMGMINIISFTDMDKLTQATCVEIFISYLWRAIQYLNLFERSEIVLSIDEFQNLPLGEGSVLRDILREGRKFGISLLLATQTLSVFPKEVRSILNQAGTKLYFRQAVNEAYNTSKEIDMRNKEHWMEILSSLKVGEAVATGNFCINGQEIYHPILTR